MLQKLETLTTEQIRQAQRDLRVEMATLYPQVIELQQKLEKVSREYTECSNMYHELERERAKREITVQRVKARQWRSKYHDEDEMSKEKQASRPKTVEQIVAAISSLPQDEIQAMIDKLKLC